MQGQHWIERSWRTIKQEYVCINPTDSAVELRQGISDFIEFYNYERPIRASTRSFRHEATD